MALFLVQLRGKRLCPLSGHDLAKLLEIGVLRGQDSLYSYQERQWYYIDEYQGLAKYYDDTPRSERPPLPTFTPPPLNSLRIVSLTEVREVIKEVVIEKDSPPSTPVEKIVERFVSPDPELYVEREQHLLELAAIKNEYTQNLAENKKTLEREQKEAKLLQFTLYDLKEEVLSLQIKNAEFEHDSDELKKSCEQFKATIAERDQSIFELRSRLAEFDKINLQQEQDNLRAEIQREFKKKWQFEKDKLIKKSVQNMRERELALKGEFERERQGLSQELEATKAQAKEVEVRFEALSAQASYSEKDIGELRSQMEQNAQRELESYQTLLTKRERELSELQGQLFKSSKLVTNLQLESERKKEELERNRDLAQKLQDETIKSVKLTAWLEIYKQELEGLKGQRAKKEDQSEVAFKQKFVALQQREFERQKESELLKQKFNKATIQIQRYKLKLQAASELIDKLKSNSKVKNEEIHKLKDEIDKLSDTPTQLINMSEIGLSRQKVASSKDSKNDAASEYSKEEIAKLIGDSFEVPNLPDWKIKTDKGIQGPYHYSEMLELKERGEISDHTLVKKRAEGAWRGMGEYFELTTNVIAHRVEVDGVQVTKYYIKRGSFRAPFYEVCSFDLQGNEVRGHCTSLSIGGAFIELARLDGDDSLREKKIFLRFSKGALSAPFGVTAVIKNVNHSRPKGIGVMFIDLPDHGREAIIEYINTYLEKLSSDAA